jgi:hypothetical protein
MPESRPCVKVEKYYAPKEFAAIRKVSERTVRRWITMHAISFEQPSGRKGRITIIA